MANRRGGCGDDVSKHEEPWSWWQVHTGGLGCLLIGLSCQNKFALVVPKFKFQPGEPGRKSCFTSRAPRTATPLSLFKPGNSGCLHRKMRGTLSTLLSQFPFSLHSWGFVHPRLLSVPELCHHVAEVWVSGTIFIRNLLLFKRQNPGKVRPFPFSLSLLGSQFSSC